MPFESQKDPVAQAPIYSRRMNEVPFSANLPKMRKTQRNSFLCQLETALWTQNLCLKGSKNSPTV
jgi:hypothetical protein